jgi:hypothetical protein
MIISASRRTDIPAFYSRWFINRIRAGYCTVPNPFNRKQVSRISLRPEDVDVIVFWTRNPQPLLAHLDELDERGYRYYFQFTILNNPRFLDVNNPPLDAAIKVFQTLTTQRPQRAIWRYDPIVISEKTDFEYHLQNYERIAQALQGHTTRSVISILDQYKKANKRLRSLEQQQHIKIQDFDDQPELLYNFLTALAGIAQQYGMELVSCAETIDLQPCGIRPGKCIDDDYIQTVFGLDVTHKKDAAQREACGCVASRDIGMYDTCLFGCQYCYATRDFATSKENYKTYDPKYHSLLPLQSMG